jgi:predicted O-methyltransferase YrrM
MNEIISPSWPIAQKKYEILGLQELLKNEKLERIVEIGTWNGATALLWAMIVSRYPKGKLYCLDLSFYYGSFYSALTGKTYDKLMYKDTEYEKYVVELKGDTHDREFINKVRNTITEPVDFMFIDGDHSYEGVKADFINYHGLVKKGGYIAFHDILDTPIHRQNGCYVEQFWEEIKEEKNFQFWEFVDNNEYLCYGAPNPSRSMGIGVIKIPA